MIGQKQLVNRNGEEMSTVIGSSVVQASQCAKNIDAMLAVMLIVSYVALASYYHLRHISHTRPSITENVPGTLVHVFVSSKLEQLACLLVFLKKLQLLQNNAARLVLRKKKRDHIPAIVPIRSRIKFNICLLTFKVLNGLAPWYITSLTTRNKLARPLHSAGRCLLE